MLGGKASGYTPMQGRGFDDSHWWLRRPDGSVLDVTAEQYDRPFPYENGRGCGFRGGKPSKLAREIMDAAGATA